MNLERIGLERLPTAAVVECSHCGNSAPIEQAGNWPRIVVLTEAARTETYDALGLCQSCHLREQTLNVPIQSVQEIEYEPQGFLFV